MDTNYRKAVETIIPDKAFSIVMQGGRYAYTLRPEVLFSITSNTNLLNDARNKSWLIDIEMQPHPQQNKHTQGMKVSITLLRKEAKASICKERIYKTIGGFGEVDIVKQHITDTIEDMIL